MLSRRRRQSVNKVIKLSEVMQQTEFSQQDLKRWHKKFKKENPSGFIEVNDIKEILRNRFPNGDPEDAASRILSIFDRDQNGQLDFFELMMALSITKKGSKEDKLRLAFSIVDTDNSGTIEFQEMEHLMDTLHKLVGITISRNSSLEDTPSAHACQMVSEFDEDEDRVITFEEFCNGVDRNPSLAALITNFANPEIICADFLN